MLRLLLILVPTFSFVYLKAITSTIEAANIRGKQVYPSGRYSRQWESELS